MREIDTEAPVVWPAWCYSANTQESAIDVITRKGDLASELLPQTATSPSSFIQTSTTILPATATIATGVSTSNNRIRAKRKNTYTTSLTTTQATSNQKSTTFSPVSIEIIAASKSEKFQQQQQQLQLSSFLIKNSTTASVEKMLSERMLMGFGAIDNNSNNNKKNCDNNSTILLYDKIKNESPVMDSSASIFKNGDLSTNNNNNNVTNNSTSSSNNIKRERLSPTVNGDVQSSISRSRSVTPSSFPGTPPQSVHSNDLVSQNILSSVQTRNNEFQARNYSDFMRSLAAKYNNSNPNDGTTARSIFFDHQKYTSGSSKVESKESPSPPEIKRQSLPTPPHVPNVPFVSSLFSGLPFSSAVFPPLIDMSSTQALVTLARAAKEAEIQNILRTAQKRPSAGQRLSPSIRSALTPTNQQQTGQFSSPPFILPSQYHSPHQNPLASSHNSRSPHHHRSNEPSTSALSCNPLILPSPLDLSSTPQSKRLKIESVTSPATSPPITAQPPHPSIKIETGSSNNNNYSPSIESSVISRVEFPRHCRAQSDEINSWNIDEVCNFVSSIDICAEYVQNFRDQCIDGSGLPLLTEDHLTNSLGMKLGPALKLRSILAKKLGGPCPCVSCTTLLHQQQQQQQTHLAPSTASSSISSTSSSSGSANSNLINSNTANAGQSISATITTNSSIMNNNPRPTSADSGS